MKNIVLTDSDVDEILQFTEGLEKSTNIKFEIKSKECNGKRSFINNIVRYFLYFFWPIKFFIRRSKYNIIIGWQQFFSLNYAFYCNLFKVRKKNILIVCNFTYKEKKGIIGKIYHKYMKFCLCNKYIDYIHVPSNNYASICSKDFNIPLKKFIVATFGIPDSYETWKNEICEYNDFVFAIGRSNRDYDFLIDLWIYSNISDLLVIACDQYKCEKKLPNNIIIRNDIVDNDQFKYLINCKAMILPIKDSNICSGDTVLLKSLCYYKPVIITKPSTLSEMYIEDGINGICISKNINQASKILKNILVDDKKLKNLSKNARESFEKKYSRYSMGCNIGNIIKVDNEK